MVYSQEIQQELDDTKYWLGAEVRNGMSPAVGINISREIVKCLSNFPVPRIKIAILSLVSAGVIGDPLALTDDDVQNALWVVRDQRIGFKENAPLVGKYLFR